MKELNLKNIEDRYEVLSTEYIDEIKSTGVYLKHRKSGARVSVLSNTDDNKVFSIAFRTPPANSTGVAHILEHSVLCGSKKFPVKDPFIELAKGSLNTFLNAMTYPDKTVYPVASYNDKDFANLCDIYMDAVLNPNIYIHPEIFYQEGWRYEIDEEDNFTINGVVYNEMKGVFSSPEQILGRALSTSLFPDTPYGMESGGDPLDIPSLTYEEFLEFHRTYYHPSNSYISFYGDMDVEEKLTWLDREYLCKYDVLEVNSQIQLQKEFEKLNIMQLSYPVNENEDLTDKNYLAYNAVYGNTMDDETCIAMDVLSYCLLDSPGAVLKKKLLAKKICKDVFGGSSNGILQPYFSVAIKDSGLSDGKEYELIVKDLLKEIVKDKLDPVAIKAAISRFEFSHREAAFDSYPKGLVYLLNMLDGWLYCDEKPFAKLYENSIYEALKTKADTGYFEGLIEKWLINNPHESVVVLLPDSEYNEKQEEKTAERIKAIKDSLSEEQIQRIRDDAKKIKAYQEKSDTKEELACIPRLRREDLSDKIIPSSNEVEEIAGIKTVYHDVSTNKITYLDMYFNLGNIDVKLIPYLGLLDALFACIRTKKKSLQELTNAIDLNTGGVSCDTLSISDVISKEAMFYTRISTRVLSGNVKEAVKIISEIINESDFTDEQQLLDVIMETKSRLAMEINGAGHQAAVRRAMANCTCDSAFTEITKGIEFYEFVSELENEFEDKKDEIINSLYELVRQIFAKENLVLSITCDREDLSEVKNALLQYEEELFSYSKSSKQDAKESAYTKLKDKDLTFDKKNEGFKLPGSVCFVAKCGYFDVDEYQFNGALSVLKTILGYEYLWKNVREQGGAYGCMCAFFRTGRSYFVSYRDPNLERTLEVYDKVLEYIDGFSADEDEMTKYIIGAISRIDSPMTPVTRGRRDMTNYITRLSDEKIKENKKEVLCATQENIRQMRGIMKSYMDKAFVCVLGDGKKIDDNRELFDSIVELKV